MKEQLKERFEEVFSKKPDYFFFCPGRVNLIGEHIDYNGGQVMPCAISLGTYLVAAKNEENKFRFRCLNFPEVADIALKENYSKNGKEWYYYPLGVINELLRNKKKLAGLDMLFYGDLPIAAGLSSSASIEVLTAFAFDTIFDLPIDKRNIAILGKKVENEFIGLNSGIMDQFAVALGKKDKAILLNCDTLEFEYIPFQTGEYVLVIINSRKQRALAESKYNERFAECREALKCLQKELQIQNLCDIDVSTFEAHRRLINDEILEKRALHVISENERVHDATRALQKGDLPAFGKLMYASHDSLKNLYEVSGRELDTIVAFARTFKHCIGARMTGAGFGGCAIALIRKGEVYDFTTGLTTAYTKAIGYPPEVFASVIGDGVHRM